MSHFTENANIVANSAIYGSGRFRHRAPPEVPIAMMRSTLEYWRNWVASITCSRPRAPILKMILMPPWQLHRPPVLPYSTRWKPLEAREHQNESSSRLLRNPAGIHSLWLARSLGYLPH